MIKGEQFLEQRKKKVFIFIESIEYPFSIYPTKEKFYFTAISSRVYQINQQILLRREKGNLTQKIGNMALTNSLLLAHSRAVKHFLNNVALLLCEIDAGILR